MDLTYNKRVVAWHTNRQPYLVAIYEAALAMVMVSPVIGRTWEPPPDLIDRFGIPTQMEVAVEEVREQLQVIIKELKDSIMVLEAWEASHQFPQRRLFVPTLKRRIQRHQEVTFHPLSKGTVFKDLSDRPSP